VGEKTDFTSHTGLGIGGVLDIRLSENVALRLEPMYLQKGAAFVSDLVDPDFSEVTFKAAYLEAPLFLKITFGASAIRPYVLAGPVIGFNMSSSLNAPGLDVETDGIVKSTDFGLGFGAGVSFPAGNNSLFIEGRYALGLADVAKAGAIELMGEQLAVDDVEIKTRGIQLMAGITFPLGGK
jgi:opacity protein-like surface antigen